MSIPILVFINKILIAPIDFKRSVCFVFNNPAFKKLIFFLPKLMLKLENLRSIGVNLLPSLINLLFHLGGLDLTVVLLDSHPFDLNFTFVLFCVHGQSGLFNFVLVVPALLGCFLDQLFDSAFEPLVGQEQRVAFAFGCSDGFGVLAAFVFEVFDSFPAQPEVVHYAFEEPHYEIGGSGFCAFSSCDFVLV